MKIREIKDYIVTPYPLKSGVPELTKHLCINTTDNISFLQNLMNSQLLEPNGSTLLISKTTTRHKPSLVPSTSHPHKMFPNGPTEYCLPLP